VNRGGRGSRGNGVQTNLNDGTGFQGAGRGNSGNTERGQRNLNLNNGICILDEE
jgi:hypothetical protein